MAYGIAINIPVSANMDIISVLENTLYFPKENNAHKIFGLDMEHAPVWQVHNAKDYNTYEEEHDDHLAMGVSLYIPIDPNHKNMGEFRIAILGGDDEEVCVPAIDVYNVLPAAVADTMLHFAFSSIKTLLPGNSTSCPWQDATTLIRNDAKYNSETI
jgi:hypothetical protein